MTPDELKARTKAFALDAIRTVRTLPADVPTQVMSKQLVRCGTSIGANYRSACLAKSKADMIAKLKLVEEEADESVYWLELLEESKTLNPAKAQAMQAEAGELFKIAAASIRTLRKGQS